MKANIQLAGDTFSQATCLLLCLAAFSFPFSVAATNVCLGISLATGIISGAFADGAIRLWQQQRWLAAALLCYLGLMVLGVAWSNDPRWGVHIIGRQWFWLLLPVVVIVLASDRWRSRFLGALTLGLVFHLLFCLLQMFGYVSVTTDGSSASEATGHIGRIGFGFVYGIWAGWLLHWGWLQDHWRRYCAWCLACWAWGMIFLAQGRSGYLVAAACLLVVLLKHVMHKRASHQAAIIAAFIIVVAFFLMIGPGKERLQGTWQALFSGQQIELTGAGITAAKATEYRWSMWTAAVEAWKSSPVLGVGTGGFPAAAEQAALKNPELIYGGRDLKPAHPHNMYLLALARWGLLGLAALAALLFFWIRIGWRQDWNASQAGILITLSGLALAVHGISSISLEEHFSAILAVLLLGVGLAEVINKPASDHASAADSSPIPPVEAPS